MSGWAVVVLALLPPTSGGLALMEVTPAAALLVAAQDGALSGDPAALAKQIRLARRSGDAAQVLQRLAALPRRLLADERVRGEQLQALLDAHRFEEAARLGNVQRPPDQGLSVPLAVALTRLAFRRGDLQAAEQNIALVRRSRPRQLDLAVLEVRIAVRRGDHRQASASLATLRPSLHPALATELEVDLALARAAELMTADDLLEQAVPLLEGALELSPERADVRSLTVRALARWQRAERAEAVALAGLQQAQGTERAELLYALGFLYLGSQRESRAVALFEEALALSPGHAKARVGLARARLRVGDSDGARRLLAEALAADPADLDALLLIADVESSLGHWDRAAEPLEKLLEVKPRHLKGLWLLSRVRARQRRPDDVQQLLQRYQERKRVLVERG